MSEPNAVVKHRVIRATPEEYLVVVLMSDGWLRLRKVKHVDTSTPKQTEVSLSATEFGSIVEWLR